MNYAGSQADSLIPGATDRLVQAKGLTNQFGQQGRDLYQLGLLANATQPVPGASRAGKASKPIPQEVQNAIIQDMKFAEVAIKQAEHFMPEAIATMQVQAVSLGLPA